MTYELIKEDDPRWFSQSSDKPYDRHNYVVTIPTTGKKITFDDYEIMRAYWFQQFSNIKGCTVEVVDTPQKSKGFGN